MGYLSDALCDLWDGSSEMWETLTCLTWLSICLRSQLVSSLSDEKIPSAMSTCHQQCQRRIFQCIIMVMLLTLQISVYLKYTFKMIITFAKHQSFNRCMFFSFCIQYNYLLISYHVCSYYFHYWYFSWSHVFVLVISHKFAAYYDKLSLLMEFRGHSYQQNGASPALISMHRSVIPSTHMGYNYWSVVELQSSFNWTSLPLKLELIDK